jgi:uncharacterized caspase-like protein
MIRGAVISESLKPGTQLEGYGLLVTKLARYEVGEVPDYQPGVWTLIEFEGPDDVAEELAEQLSGVLAEPGWYANFYSDTESFVVFANKVFRYRRGDGKGREEAQTYGRTRGVPEPQLDWRD